MLCLHACLGTTCIQCPQMPKGDMESLQLEFLMVVRHHVSARNGTQDLWKKQLAFLTAESPLQSNALVWGFGLVLFLNSWKPVAGVPWPRAMQDWEISVPLLMRGSSSLSSYGQLVIVGEGVHEALPLSEMLFKVKDCGERGIISLVDHTHARIWNTVDHKIKMTWK